MIRDFDFYVGGIEDGMLKALETEMKALGVKTFASYSGELEPDTLKKAIAALTPKFPLVMVCYAGGKDINLPRTSPVFGASRVFQHECSFAVICAADDSRGETARRRGAGFKKIGAYQMLAAARDILSDLQLTARVEGEDEPELLTYQPLTPSATEFIARIPEVTAYAEIFDTYFKWETRDRSKPGRAVEEIIVGVDRINTPTELPGNLPGVKFIGG